MANNNIFKNGLTIVNLPTLYLYISVAIQHYVFLNLQVTKCIL